MFIYIHSQPSCEHVKEPFNIMYSHVETKYILLRLIPHDLMRILD